MNSTSTHFVPPRRVGIYEPLHQFGMWGETFKNNIGNGEDMNTPSHIIIPNNQKLDDNNLEATLFYETIVYTYIRLDSRVCSLVKEAGSLVNEVKWNTFGSSFAVLDSGLGSEMGDPSQRTLGGKAVKPTQNSISTISSISS
ncbi:hypothetical protein DY000_02005756 [Brassica cretica]|uniref:Uncharacterized protein n=1 Tax=Brassica cretica TaxID=69181 RepID=A0ABQ7BS18_BRACR|nr:hypothetical protein DY000_02005756 [Brassica cretica]